MALKSSTVQCLPILSGSTHSLPLKLGLTHWSGCASKTSFRHTWTALPGVSNSPRLAICQQRSFRNLARPHLPHCSAQPLIASRVTPLLPRNNFQGIRRNHSETSEEDQATGNKLPQLLLWSIFVAWVSNRIGRKQGVDDLTAQLPEATMSAEREALRKEEEALKHHPRNIQKCHHCRKCDCLFHVRHDMSRKERMELAEKVDALDTKELERLKQRATTLEEDIETQRKSIETDKAEETPPEDVTAIEFPSHPSDMVRHYLLREEGETAYECPICSGEVADPRARKAKITPSTNVVPRVANQALDAHKMPNSPPPQDKSTHIKPTRKANISPSANIVPQVTNQELDSSKIPKPPPPQDRSTPPTKPDTTPSNPPKPNTGPTPAPAATPETLSAERDATNEEMDQIKRAREALASREKSLEAKSKEQKKHMQELNAPKADQTWPVVQGMLFGSALAFGVMASIFRN